MPDESITGRVRVLRRYGKWMVLIDGLPSWVMLDLSKEMHENNENLRYSGATWGNDAPICLQLITANYEVQVSKEDNKEGNNQ